MEMNINSSFENNEVEDGDGDGDGDCEVITRKRVKTKPPKLYKVILHNDDYTTMDFVLLVLTRYFNKNSSDAYAMMLNIHNKGSEVCGIYTFEIAETKKDKVMKEAKEKNFPLLCTIEKE